MQISSSSEEEVEEHITETFRRTNTKLSCTKQLDMSKYIDRKIEKDQTDKANEDINILDEKP